MAQLQPYCAIEGNDDGLPVVFVHGMGVDHRSLMMLDKAFDGNDSIRRIYLDLPGFGRTPALPEHACGLPEMADWLQTAIDGLVGKAAPFAMVGNSMGGALVREVLAREPRRVAGMALIAPVVDPQHAGRHVAEHVVAQSQADALLAAGPGVRFHYHGRQPVIRRVATLPTVHPARRGVVRPCGMRTTGSALLAGR